MGRLWFLFKKIPFNWAWNISHTKREKRSKKFHHSLHRSSSIKEGWLRYVQRTLSADGSPPPWGRWGLPHAAGDSLHRGNRYTKRIAKDTHRTRQAEPYHGRRQASALLLKNSTLRVLRGLAVKKIPPTQGDSQTLPFITIALIIFIQKIPWKSFMIAWISPC